MSLFQLFTKKPSDDIIKEILSVTGLGSLEEPKEISRSQLSNPETIKKYLEIQPIVSTYYIPCKSKKYITTDPTAKNIITVIRHLLKTRGYAVQSQEKYQSGHKTVFYKVAPKSAGKIPNELHIVKFD
jgi:hypothetical protein